ncbi:MAG TPA: acetyl-CoA decarbonylase/synthase complex subunit gamma [bacterium]|nr:acetyl-CoA decarbonylase/synthase complex subunit gamma [bacterium]HOL46767.1 acetyl-CoA decarbonylase/synthase complex subunit gamma [bacterium]HPQ17722.1 acetyl-CoA decarbonylase/synthase complex subunit gamma [bacterium]
MALTGLQIFKLLPNKNCKECGVPTCLAFAMKIAAKSVEPTLCPYISQEALEKLNAEQAPPVKVLKFNINNNIYEIGGETVLYRHDKIFVNRTLIGFNLDDDLDDDVFQKRVNQIINFKYERIGEVYYPEIIGLTNKTNNKDNFLKKYKIVSQTEKIIILSKINFEILKEILNIEKNNNRIIINNVDEKVLEEIKEIVKEKEIKIVLESDNVNNLLKLTENANKIGLKNLLIKFKQKNISDLLVNNYRIRRLAIIENNKNGGFPIFTECQSIYEAIAGICKYSSIIILNEFDLLSLKTLLILRQNIYTDPRKPLQIEPGVYKIGNPDENSPLLVTTNFSLTYFIVSGEIANSAFSARLVITDSEGMSVLTAWSANKFNSTIITKAIKTFNVENEIKHRKIIIPGYVAVLKGELEDELKNWQIMVGPQEAADLPDYLKEMWQ